MENVHAEPESPPADAALPGVVDEPLPSVAAIYEAHVTRIWRTLRALGVDEARVEDAVQDVFVTVHQKLASFERRSALSTWVYGIARRVAAGYRRRPGEARADETALARLRDPHDHVERSEVSRLLLAMLDELDDEGREVVVLMELEQLAAPEVAELLGIPLNTVYSRLRTARKKLEAAAARRQAKERP